MWKEVISGRAKMVRFEGMVVPIKLYICKAWVIDRDVQRRIKCVGNLMFEDNILCEVV